MVRPFLLRVAAVALAIIVAQVPANPSVALAAEFRPNNPLNQPGKIYWCPGRTPDKQISATPDADCAALYDAERDGKKPRRYGRRDEQEAPPPEPFKILEIQNEASKFTKEYRAFLDCCVSDIDSLEKIDELLDHANQILLSVQQKGIYNRAGFGVGSGPGGLGGGAGQAPKLGTFARQWTLSEIVGTVARGRDDLRKIEARLVDIIGRMEKLDALGYEERGIETRQLEEEREGLRNQFLSRKPPASAPTGMDIQDTTLPVRIGGDIESTDLNQSLNPSFGADIGATVSPYSDVNESLKPRRGEEARDSVLTDRVGPRTQDTNLPNRFGFDIEKSENPLGASSVQGRGVGPGIGDSPLNSPTRR
ncbi:MAG TPA: hypothetical protein VFQ34_05070 [Nitrospiraceae bacterium]|nr:hypothetical protein [Nitrospiraceae bacterium]